MDLFSISVYFPFFLPKQRFAALHLAGIGQPLQGLKAGFLVAVFFFA